MTEQASQSLPTRGPHSKEGSSGSGKSRIRDWHRDTPCVREVCCTTFDENHAHIIYIFIRTRFGQIKIMLENEKDVCRILNLPRDQKGKAALLE